MRLGLLLGRARVEAVTVLIDATDVAHTYSK